MNLLFKIIELAKIILPTFAGIYLIVWVIQLFNEDLFNMLDKIFGLLPNIFNAMLEITSDIMGQDVLMGYPYVALIFVAIFGLLFKFDNEIREKFSQYENTKINQPKPKKQEKIKVQKQKEPKKQKESKKQQEKTIKQQEKKIKEVEEIKENADITAFYGLLTFELKYLNDEEIDKETQQILKHSYAKILVEKLKEKYGSVNYAVSDKVFFICNNVSLFNLFVRDIVKLNKIISQISEKQKIKTALKVSFWSNPKATPKQACAILLRINRLNYLNKVIVSKYIQLKFDRQLIKCFDFCSLGTVKLSKQNSQDNDIDMELFYLKTLDD